MQYNRFSDKLGVIAILSKQVMRRLVPSFILDKFEAGEQHGTFPAAVLVADVTAFTTFTESLMQYGPEAAEVLADAMQIVFEPLVHTIWAQQGFVANFAGDAVIAVFPGREQALRRALAAAHAIRQHADTNPRYALPLGDFRLDVRLALATGPVEWGIIYNQEHTGPSLAASSYYFGGPALVAAGRVGAELRAGAIGLAPSAATQLGGLIEGVPGTGHLRLTTINGGLPQPVPLRFAGTLPSSQQAFVPAALHEQQVRGEFRQLVTLFLNLQEGHTYQQLEPFVQTVLSLQQKYGGYLGDIEQSEMGSALLLFWGVPSSFENDVVRALNFVLELLEQTPTIFRAGLTFRPMYAGFVGATMRQEYGGYGQGINLATRLMQSASWGSVWLDESAARQAADFRLELLGKLPLKGFSLRQPVYLLLGTRQGQGQSYYPGRLVGRDAELTRLLTFLRPLGQGRFAGSITIQGEAGIGKSRLVHTLQADSGRLSQISGESGVLPQWFLCPTDQLLRHSLHPFRHFLRRYFWQREAAPESVNKSAFDRRLDALLASTAEPALVAELERTRSFLAALLDLHWPDSLYASLDEARRFENTLIAIKTLFKAESRRRPVIIHLEDAHWLDDDSRHFLRELTRNVENYPIALLLTVRPEQKPGILDSLPPHEEMYLSPLTASELKALAESFLEGTISHSLAELVWERAEGNPLFAEQIMLYLREQRFLHHDGDGHYSLAILPDWTLPGNVRSLLVARLDRLPPAVKTVAQTASVLGREFDLAVVAQMLPEVTDLSARVEAATAAAIWSPVGESRYLFRHILLRDAAYEMQLRARRRWLHQLAAEAMETVYAPDLSSHAADLAYHYEAAGATETAVAWYWRAAQQATTDYANEIALNYYSRALALLPPADSSRRFALLQARCQVYGIQGNREAQLGDLRVLATLSARLGTGAERSVALEWAVYANAVGDYPRAVAHASEAAAAAELASAAHWEWGRALWRQQNHAEAKTHFEQALALARDREDVELIARNLNGLGMVVDSQGHYKEAAGYYARALHHQQALDDLPGQSLTFTNLGWMAFMQGHSFQAQRYYERALYLDRRTGNRLSQSTALNNLGVVAFMHGKGDQALDYYRQGLELSREVGNQPGEATLLSNLALLYHRLDEDEKAIVHAEAAIALAGEVGVSSIAAEARAHRGHALLALGRVEAATAAYRRSVCLWVELGRPEMGVEALAGLVRLALQEGKSAAAGRIAVQIADYLEHGPPHGILEPYRVYLSCYQGLLATGDRRADLLLEDAYWNLREQIVTIQDEQTRSCFLLNVPARKEIVRLWRQRQPSAE